MVYLAVAAVAVRLGIAIAADRPDPPPVLLSWARGEACAAWSAVGGGTADGRGLPRNCSWSNQPGPGGAVRPGAQGTPWLVMVDPTSAATSPIPAVTSSVAEWLDIRGPFIALPGPAEPSTLYGFAYVNLTFRALAQIGTPGANGSAPAVPPVAIRPVAGGPDRKFGGWPGNVLPTWHTFVPAGAHAESEGPWMLAYSAEIAHGGPAPILTERMSAVHGLALGSSQPAILVELWNRTTASESPQPHFGDEWALDSAPAGGSDGDHTLYTQSGGRDIVVTSFLDGSKPWGSTNRLASPVARPSPSTVPAHGQDYTCLHFDRTSPGSGGGNLRALTKTESRYELVDIDVANGATTLLVTLPDYSPMVIQSGRCQCSFSPSTGLLAVLFTKVDTAALPFAQAASLGLVTIDTRAAARRARGGGLGPVAPMTMTFPFGKPGSGQTWRTVEAGLAFAG